jgi:hypothetical protein
MDLLKRLQQYIDGLREQKSPVVSVEPVVETYLETPSEIPSGDQLVEDEKEPVGGAKEVESDETNANVDKQISADEPMETEGEAEKTVFFGPAEEPKVEERFRSRKRSFTNRQPGRGYKHRKNRFRSLRHRHFGIVLANPF